jgi:anaerobic selenocysteine-containing dehydrogenase
MTTVAPSVCPLDCPDRCSLDVHVHAGRVVSLEGSHRNPATEGYICGKVAQFGRRVHGPERVLYPAVRVGPKGPGARFERVSWDEALALAADRLGRILAESGGEAILPYWYGGSNGYLTGGGLDARLWAWLGTTQIQRTLCAANAGAAVTSVYGDLPSADPGDVASANGLVLWGVNPSASGIHLVRGARAVAERGDLLVVDPRATPLTRKAALHLAPIPGTDVAVALALIHLAFARGFADEGFLARYADDADAMRRYVADWTPSRAALIAQVRSADIEAFAERYAATAPFLIRCGWGVERTRNGTDAIRAILSLPAVYGKFGVRGGGYAMSTSGGYRTDKTRTHPPHPPTRTVNMSRLGRILEETRGPPIRAVWVYDCNPVATVPDQERVMRGLSRDDLFTVVHEQVWTDTCAYADLVLPATTFLEHHELTRSYGGYLFQWAPPVIPPVGEARPNHRVFAELGRALGVEDPELRITEEELARRVLAATPAAPADAWERLQTDRVVALPCPVQFGDAFPSRPIRLVADDPPRYRPPPVDADRPLVLVSPSSPRGISSTLFETLGAGEARVYVHPDDAEARGVAAGDVVRVWNSVGECRLLAEVDADLRPGVCAIPKGVWRRSTLDGRTGNALVGDHVDERGGGACYNDARVDLERVPTRA